MQIQQNPIINKVQHNDLNKEASFQTILLHNNYPQLTPMQDSKIHRFGKDDKLWYIHYGTHGIAGDWSEELQKIKWYDKLKWNNLSKQEQETKRLEIKKAQEESEMLKEETHKQASIEAGKIYNQSSKIAINEYLSRSGVNDSSMKIAISTTNKYLNQKQINNFVNLDPNIRFNPNNNQLIIPLFDINGELMSLQFIHEDGKKQFLKDGRTKSYFHTLGNLNNIKEAYICEGYATGLTIHAITRKPVMICFYAGNIVSVLEELTKEYPLINFIIAGDNDQYSQINTGKLKAEEASKRFNCKMILPGFKDISTNPTDYNDLYILEGGDEILRQLEEPLKKDLTKPTSINESNNNIKSKTLNAINIADLLELEIKPKESILHPIINEGSLAMIYAKRGIGKTFVSLEIAFAVSSGGNMFNDKWQSNQARNVLFIDGEMPAITIKERLAEITLRSKIQTFNPHNLQIITPDLQDLGMPDLATVEGQVAIEEYIADDTSLIILDNLSTLCRTGRENENESWLVMQEWILSLRKRGIAVLLIHHAGKNGEQRGNSKKEDVLDTVINLKRPNDYKSEEGARFEVIYTKARNFSGDIAKSFEAKLTETGWVVNDIENELENEVLEYAKDGLNHREISKMIEGASESKVYRILKEHGLNKKTNRKNI